MFYERPPGPPRCVVARRGFVVPPDEGDALAAGIPRVLADDELRARLGAAGPPFVRANYDRAAVMREFAQTVLALPRLSR